MTFRHAINMFLHDMRAEGRITSDRSERAYFDCLLAHADDVANRDPRATGRDDVKRTLRRWANPNTQSTRRAVLVSFYDWCMEEGYRKDNPARQTRRPKRRKAQVYRLTRGETAAMMLAAEPGLEQRAIYLLACLGLRSQEARGLKAIHFQRDGFVWVSPDIAKGGHERYIPVIPDLQPIVDDIVATVAPAHYVLCGQKTGLAGRERIQFRTLLPEQPMGATTIYKLVKRVGQRAGIAADVHPHLLRHSYADHVTRESGLQIAQELMGHADVSTTRGYTNRPTLEELADAVRGVSFIHAHGYPPEGAPESAVVETVGIEPTTPALRDSSPGGDEQETP